MPVPESLKEVTRQEWRDLGFYYAQDDAPQGAWRIVGSTVGLAAFLAKLVEYAARPSNAGLGEHEHYGPYFYLKVMTSSDAGIDAHSIRGSLADLRRLADLVSKALAHAKPGDLVALGGDYVERPSYELLLDVREDNFDPASADPDLR
jgi:hypothetical protein